MKVTSPNNIASGLTALGLQRFFEGANSADNPALAKYVGPGANAP
ncbi:hypothetical protein GCM10010917_15850 [Paenibacillus physcomitrellae]|uniref:Uncharacterized protein n=1 Tax=Paenibacillus physcomitrellae TaxID=1619311 RepID=A0ABQ1FWU4_9BACL|nr:hypothetical protein GCM10010917_15850 [Paenibacillus physcomitrellae]